MEHLDFVGLNSNLYISGRAKYSNRISITLSIVLYSVSVLYIIFAGSEIVYKTKRFISYDQKLNKISEFDIKDLNLTIRPIKMDMSEISDINMKLEIKLEKGVTNFDTDEPITPLKHFEEKGLFGLNSNNQTEHSTFRTNSHDYHLLSSSKDSLLMSNSTTREKSVFFLVIRLCSNVSLNGLCLPSDEIISELEYFKLHIMHKSYYIDNSNVDTPLVEYYVSTVLTVSSLKSNSQEYVIELIEYNSDNGIVFTNNFKSHAFSTSTRYNVINPYISGEIFKIKFTIGSLYREYFRTYVKIQNLLAETGSIFNLFYLIFMPVNYIFSRPFFLDTIFKQIFKTEYENEMSQPSRMRLGPAGKIFPLLLVKVERPNINQINYNIKSHQTLKYTAAFCGRCRNKDDFTLRKKNFNLIDSLMRKNLDVKNIIKISEKLKLTDEMLFGEEGKRMKGALLSQTLLEKQKRKLSPLKTEIIKISKDKIINIKKPEFGNR